ncbi:MAG: TAT-variant-translocated molybdopterin oxidoreductase [Vicinamibacterales bacterium]|nr:TAT-variant-translocated molybdopterin oxidoreductase [Vicinamibacterales bacterium]
MSLLKIQTNRNSQKFWRTLEERANEPAFQEQLHNEFPSEIEAISDPVQRRSFLKLMGASIALAGVTACTRQPTEAIVPYVRQPEELVPGKPLYFATAMALGGVATGLLVESHEGRPTKIEGNPEHPASLGAADVYAQAAILGLYDPDRAKTLTNLGELHPWSSFLATIRAALVAQTPYAGAGVRILTESVSSPTLAAQIRELQSRYPSLKWHQWDPASRNAARVGARMAFGEFVDARYDVAKADVVLSLDADFLNAGPASLRYAREFFGRRRPEGAEAMNRLYAVETMPTPTGSRADHRLALRPSAVGAFAFALAQALGAPGIDAAASARGLDGKEAQRFLAAVTADLKAHAGKSLVVAGDSQPAAVHALAHAINQVLGNVGATVSYAQPAEAEPVDQAESLSELVSAMNAGRVDVLVILSANPVYSAPADLKFGEAMAKVRVRVRLGLYEDETSALCHWQIPEAHFLESWSDARAFDGSVSIVQPLVAPLYGGKTAHEVVAALSDTPEAKAYEIIRKSWKIDETNEASWREWLHNGLVANSAHAPKAVTVTGSIPVPAAPAAGVEIAFRNDATVLDGRFGNNGWLQELPKPISKLTWDNAIYVSPATLAGLQGSSAPTYRGGEHGTYESSVFEIRLGGQVVRGPVFQVVGHADDCATVHLGYGRTRGGNTANGAGFDVSPIRTASTLEIASGAQLVKTDATYDLACTQGHHLMEGRDIIRAVTREEYLHDPKSMQEGDETPARTLTLYAPQEYTGYKWGMAIDVNSCFGCNACVVSCQAENNIPVVGKDQVLRGREMHWIRVDSYYRGEAENPETYFQPVPCMQCENAPCEPVCPAGATAHSHEGLNDMVYNRCVGTRYCSNNCPYKVRRFNYFLYQDWDTPSLKLARNPDVTVRSRGVMEKCTYCVQRINAAKIEAQKEDRKVRDGEIKTACQQTCPADAIAFGDLNDPESRVARLQAEQRNYALLGELNTRPRTTYLGAVRNVNPDLGK